MLFNVALSSSLLSALAVLAIPSGLGSHAARYEGLELASDDVYQSTWAGAVLTSSDRMFDTISGIFIVPTPLGQTGASATAWVGIDGVICASSIMAGVVFSVGSDQPTYLAWYQWLPGGPIALPNIAISAKDIIKITVVAWSTTFGTAVIENLSNGQVMSESLTSSAPLCGQSAEWIVQVTDTVALADFGTVTFANAVATGPTGIYNPSGASILNISLVEDLTSVSISESSVTIQYM